MNKTINVHIGEIKIAKRGERLKAILGSCVGIGLLWKEQRKCGLVHCLLPRNPVHSFDIGARFVDQAVRSLRAMLKFSPDDAKFVDAVVVGGGNMTGSHPSSELVGENNFRTAMQELTKLGVKIVHADGGGDLGRQIVVDSELMTYQVDVIPRISHLNSVAT